VGAWARNNTLRGVFLERVASGELHVEIDRSFPLADAVAAHEYVESRNAFGRVIITP
jgi:NADPH2:quinone reductase